MRIPLMQRLILSLLVTGSIFVPHASIAQHYGGQYYPPTPHRYGYQNHFGGDTVIYDGQVLTNNLPPGANTCHWVEVSGRPCEYFYEQRNSTGYTTHYVGRPRPRLGIQNYFLPQQNPDLNNNQQWGHPAPIWQNNSGCVYQNKHVRILCN